MVMCIQRKIFVMDWKIPPSSLKQNAIPAPRGFAPRVWNLHFAFVIRVEFFNPSLKFSLDSLNSKGDLPLASSSFVQFMSGGVYATFVQVTRPYPSTNF